MVAIPRSAFAALLLSLYLPFPVAGRIKGEEKVGGPFIEIVIPTN